MIVLGDFHAGDTVYFYFDTYNSAGASVTITGLATSDLELYRDGAITQRASDNGFALLDSDGIDVDGTVGLHGFSIDTSDNSDAGFYQAGSQYLLNVNAITVDGQTVRFSYYFSLGRLLKPTTAGRKLDVSSGGEAGLDWANVGSPTTTVNLSATTVKTATDVETDTVNIQSRIPAALSGGRMDASVGAYQGALAPPSSSANADAVHAYNIAETEFSVGTQGDYTKNKLLRSTIDGRTLDVSAAGNAGIDWGNVEAPTTTVGLTGTTIAAVTTVNGLAANVITAASIAATALNDKGNWNVGKTGYSLTQAFPANFSVMAISALSGKVTVGTNDDKTGYSLAQTFPANFSDLSISVTTGKVTAGTVDDKTGYSLSGTITNLDALDTEQDAQHATTRVGVNSLLTRVPAAIFTGITGSIAQWFGLIAGKQVGDATARTELRDTGAGAGTFDETLHSQQALRERGDAAWITGAGGGGGGVVLLPAVANIPNRLDGTTITAFNRETTIRNIPLVDATGEPIDLTGANLWFGVVDAEKNTVFTATPTGTATGFTVVFPPMTKQATHQWALRYDKDVGDSVTLAHGYLVVRWLPYQE